MHNIKNIIALYLSVFPLLAIRRWKNVAVVVEHTFQDIRYRNGHVVEVSPLEKHYQLKFFGRRAKKNMDEFLDYCDELEGLYDFREDLNINVGIVPEGFDCMCSFIEHHLRNKGYKTLPVANKFHLFFK